MIKSKIIKSNSNGSLENKINKFCEENEITKNEFVDLKLNVDSNEYVAIIVYEK